MATPTKVFDIERKDQTLLVTVLTDLREFNFHDVEAGADEIFRQLSNGAIKNVVLDFHKTDYYGSTALGFFIKLWKRVRHHNGRLAFCGVSPHEKEILNITRLDGLWPICETREEAIKTVEATRATS